MKAPRPLIAMFALTLGFAAAARATTWNAGDLVTISQGNWGDETGEGVFLLAHYDSVYASTSGTIEIGLDPGGFAAVFTTGQHVVDFLPQSGDPGVLDANVLNPTLTSAGFFAGVVMALKLNVDFSDAGLLQGNLPLHFGDVVLVNLADTPDLDGLTVRDFLGVANGALGGGPTPYAISDLSAIADELQFSFGAGAGVSPWAQDHLAAPAPEPDTSLLLLGSGLTLLAGRRIQRLRA